MTLGVPARGRQRDGPFNHATNKGWVKEQKGHYHDGIFNKKNRCVTFIVEALGGVAPHAATSCSSSGILIHSLGLLVKHSSLAIDAFALRSSLLSNTLCQARRAIPP